MQGKTEALGGESDQTFAPTEGHNSVFNHTGKLERYATGKTRTNDMSGYLAEYRKLIKGFLGQKAGKLSSKLFECGNYLKFHHYYEIEEIRLAEAHFCKQYRLCPLCAMRRGGLLSRKYKERYDFILESNPHLKAFFVTLTIKDGEDLQERFFHLVESYKFLDAKRRRTKSGGRNLSVWCAVEGAVGAYEVTRGKNSGLWHPHIHLVVLAESMPTEQDANGRWRCRALETEWEAITGDSKVVDVRPFDVDQTPDKSFCEVFKYALKFSALTLADNWHAARMLFGRRMVITTGLFRGVKIPKELTDDPLLDEPYIELIYRYFKGSGYNFIPEKMEVI